MQTLYKKGWCQFSINNVQKQFHLKTQLGDNHFRFSKQPDLNATKNIQTCKLGMQVLCLLVQKDNPIPKKNTKLDVKLTLFRVRTAANRNTGLDELKKSCKTVMAGVSSRLVTPVNSVTARAASKITISVLCLKQPSR